MILADHELRREISVGNLRFDPPIDLDIQIQNASIDLRLGTTVRKPVYLEGFHLSPKEQVRQEGYGERRTVEHNGYNLEPHEFLLAETLEYLTVPLELCGRLEGKSSLARLGLMIHFTSAHIAPGFTGIITLEMINLGPNVIVLKPEMLIGQVIFERMSAPPLAGYGGRFSGQIDP